MRVTAPAMLLALSALLAQGGCGPTGAGGNDQRDGPGAGLDGGRTDAASDRPLPLSDAVAAVDGRDGPTVRPDGGCAAAVCPNPIDDRCGSAELCGANGTGDGLDNNCNGQVDEGCPCTPGDVHPCFAGPPGRRNVGSCVDGTQRCEGDPEFARWGDCTGGLWPTAETCDTQDNDCNGCADDHPECCDVELTCPGPGDLPEAAPFVNYVINGAQFYPGPTTSWSWTVVGGPCDQLLQATSGHTSYTLTGANTSQVTFRPTLSGDYTFTMTVVTAAGETYTCVFIVHVRGPGMRVELCWDTTGQADIDLHVHRPGNTTPWFTNSLTGDSSDINNDDCYYENCRAANFVVPLSGPQWGYPQSPLAECVGAPGGNFWSLIGSCHNPRLDVDNISTPGWPENINVDNPHNGDTFRVMVHYYGPAGGGPLTHPMVNVYCGGYLLGTYGAAPDLVDGFTQGGGFGEGIMWRVVDVTMQVGATTSCDLAPLHAPGTTSGYWVTNGDRSY